jgi:hypothetical protein
MAGPPTQIPPTTEYAALVAWLQARGLTAAHINASIGPAVANRDRKHIAASLTAWFKTRPKG